MNKHPNQAVYEDDEGELRYRENKIVQFLKHAAQNGFKYDLNQMAMMNFDKEDWIQFYQLLGYTQDGIDEIFEE